MPWARNSINGAWTPLKIAEKYFGMCGVFYAYFIAAIEAVKIVLGYLYA